MTAEYNQVITNYGNTAIRAINKPRQNIVIMKLWGEKNWICWITMGMMDERLLDEGDWPRSDGCGDVSLRSSIVLIKTAGMQCQFKLYVGHTCQFAIHPTFIHPSIVVSSALLLSLLICFAFFNIFSFDCFV